MKFYTIVLITVTIAFVGCSRGPAKISVANGSGITLSNVWVSSEHFATSFGTLTPGMSVSVPLTSRLDTNIWVTFEATGQKHDSRGEDRPSYFEVSLQHQLSLTIETDLTVNNR